MSTFSEDAPIGKRGATDADPECGEIEFLGERTFMWDCKHREWIDVSPPPNYEEKFAPFVLR